MKKLEDICIVYLEGYFYAKITEHLITSKIQSVDFDKLKKATVECMKDYIEHSDFSIHNSLYNIGFADLVLIQNSTFEIAEGCYSCFYLSST